MAGDKNEGHRGVDGYYVDKGKMDSPWFSGDNDSAGRKAMHGAPRVSGMDGCTDGIRDGTSGANDAGGAGTSPGARKK